MTTEMKCPVSTSAPMNAPAATRTNADWWPNGLNIAMLHQQPPGASPMPDDFDYAAEFKTLDLHAVVADLTALIIDS